MNNLIGELIKYYRTSSKLSQADLALGICSREYIGKIERGEHEPSLEIISAFSERLNVNLYHAYSTAYKYNSIDVYKIYNSLNVAFASENTAEIRRLVSIAEKTSGFRNGEPYRILCYAKSLLLFSEKKWETAIEMLENGLEFLYDQEHCYHADSLLENIDFALSLSLGVNLCNTSRRDKGIHILREIKNRAFYLLNHCTFDIDIKRAFWINIICSSQINLYAFSPSIPIEMLDEIDEIITYQAQNKRSHMIADLLYCKAAILMNHNRIEEAKSIFTSAQTIGSIYYSPERLQQISENIISKQSELALFDER